jgi:hypothetical protein
VPARPGDDRQGLLDEEVALLGEAGYAVLDVRPSGNGIYELLVEAPDEKTGVGQVELRIDLPASYPYMPPTVFADGLSLSHHQHPFSRNLCLIERSTKNWIPEWHVAGLLDNQLKRAIAAGDAAPGEGIEEFEQGEPYSAYYSYRVNSALLSDVQGLAPSPGDNGKISVSLLSDPVAEQRLVGTLDEIAINGIAHARERVTAVFGRFGPDRLAGRWVMLDRPPATNDASEMWALAEAADVLHASPNNCSDRTVREVRLVAFPEEHGYNSTGIGWVFLVKEHGATHGSRQDRRSRGAQREPDRYHLLPVYRAGRDDLVYRSPEARGLESKAVMVIGCGAIGSVLVEHLARAGVGHFHLVDFDQLEPGNVSRHACGMDMAGTNKVIALARRVLEVNPYAEVAPVAAAIGATFASGGEVTETDALKAAMKSVDLVIDATAEIGVQEYTSTLSRSVGTTWLSADGTQGVGGGCVARVDAGSDACFSCLCWHQYEESLPTPIKVETGLVQPAGCASPTFTGTGFDLAVISLQAARVAVGALLRGVPGGYPEDGHDVYVLEMRDEHGEPCPPAWRGYELQRHPRCPYH